MSRPAKLYDFAGERLTVLEIATRSGVPLGALHQRLGRGWSAEDAASLPLQPVGRRAAMVAPPPLVDAATPYEHDLAARIFVHRYPNGATHELVGEMIGMTRGATAKLEHMALRKLRKRMQLVGLSIADIAGREPDLWDAIAEAMS